MEYRAIGMVELNSVAKGIECADQMVKTATIEIVTARPSCPGRYLIMVSGDVGSIQNAVDVGKLAADEFLVDWFIIPNASPELFPALNGTTRIREIDALGVIETYSVASCIAAADGAAKAADVDLIEIRCATGLAGKSYIILTGDVGSVKAAVDAGVALVKEDGQVVCHVVLPAPDKDLIERLL